MTLFQNTNVAARDSASIDAFARWRVSNPETLFDSKQTTSNAPEFWDDQLVSGTGGASTWSQATASTVLSVPDTTACRRIRQTFMRMNYQPGKSQLAFLTGTLKSGGGTGITRAMGLFDDDNGIFAIDDEGTVKFVIRSSTSGSPVDNAVAQANWNIDPLDGTGPSGITLDPTKSQILLIDYEWLGVGRVRCGWVVDGIPVYAHEFVHSNRESGVYMTTPNLPIRYEIENDGTGAASELEHICASIISEGGQKPLGNDHYYSTGASFINANASGTSYAIFGVRLKSTKLDAAVIVNGIDVMTSTSDNYYWQLLMNPTIAGAARSWSSEADAPYEYAIGDAANPSTNTVTGGHPLAGGFGKSGASSQVAATIDTQLRLGASIAGVQDEIWLCVTPLASNADVYGGLSIKDAT